MHCATIPTIDLPIPLLTLHKINARMYFYYFSTEFPYLCSNNVKILVFKIHSSVS